MAPVGKKVQIQATLVITKRNDKIFCCFLKNKTAKKTFYCREGGESEVFDISEMCFLKKETHFEAKGKKNKQRENESIF